MSSGAEATSESRLIPGFTWNSSPTGFIVLGLHDSFAEWDGLMCLGVALSIAGALTAAYNQGKWDGFSVGWDDGWDARQRNDDNF